MRNILNVKKESYNYPTSDLIFEVEGVVINNELENLLFSYSLVVGN